MNKKNIFSAYSLFIWGLAILFFFYEFFLRVLPATISTNIVHSLNINIEQFAILGSAYYLTYSFMQIPVGILLDRYSIRFLVTLAVGLCSLGALSFTFADGFTLAFISRIFIGFGSSFGFISLMIITLNWFPKKHFAFMLGWGQFLGAIGPLIAGAPIAMLLHAVNGDWRFIFLWVAIFGFILTALIGIFLRGKQVDPDAIIFIHRKDSLSKQLKEIFTRSQIWWTMAYSSTVYVSLPLLGAFWGTAYLETRGFNKSSAALLTSMIWLGLAIGCPIIGKLSDRIKRRIPLSAFCAGVGVVSSLLVLFSSTNNQYYLGILFFLIGFAGAGQSLSFAIITENAPKKIRATALGMNNTSLMALASIVPPIVTSIIQHYTTGNKVTLLAFEKGLTIMPFCFFIALIISLTGIKETYCRQQRELHFLKKN